MTKRKKNTVVRLWVTYDRGVTTGDRTAIIKGQVFI